MTSGILRLLTASLACAALFAQASKYSGPRPEKPDLPYVLHATRLIPIEAAEAKQSTEKDNDVYTVPGVSSPAKTPLPEPIFFFKSERINPDKLDLYRMDVKGGARILTIPTGKKSKNAPKPVFMMVTKLEAGLFRVEVNEQIETGEYCMSPQGSNQVFCFSIF